MIRKLSLTVMIEILNQLNQNETVRRTSNILNEVVKQEHAITSSKIQCMNIQKILQSI